MWASSPTSHTKPRPAAVSSRAIAAPMPRLAPVIRMVPSGIDEPRLALGLERGRAFLGILGLERQGGKIGLELQPGVDRQIERTLHRAAGERQYRQAIADELA